MLTKEQAKQVIDRVVAASKADEVHIRVGSEELTQLRFARNAPSTSGSSSDVALHVASTFGKKTGSASVNQLDDASIADAVRRSEELARLAPEDPEHMPALEPQAYPSVAAFDASVRDRGAAQLAAGVATCIKGAMDQGLIAAGFGTAQADVSAIGNSRGLFGYHTESAAHFSQTVRTADGKGSGWSSAVGRGVGGIDFPRSSSVAIDKAVRSKDPRPLDPGKYVTILEPACVANLVRMFVGAMDARSADEGRSFFARPGGGNRLGEKLFSDRVSIYSDPTDASVPGRPWADDFLPQQRRDWIEGGVVANLAYDRYWALEQGKQPVPTASNTLMAGGTGTLEELIADTKRGVLITSLWYIRSVDPKTMLYTGLTRDGVFLIENGEISHPLTNFRWNDSPVSVLKNIDAMTAPQHVSPRSWTSAGVSVPALRVTEFELSSVSDAV